MDPVDVLLIKQACAEVFARYALAVNEWDIDTFVSLFDTDAVWYRPASGEICGQAAIRAFMESQPTASERVVRHVNGAHLVEVVDDAHATSWSQTTVYEAPATATLPAPVTGPDMVVEYRHRLVRRGDAWLIARQDTSIVFQAGA